MGSRPHLKAAVLGALKSDGSPIPLGSGIPVDGARRLLTSCAHVWNDILEMYETSSSTSTVLDPREHGVAVGFAKEDGIEWVGRAELRRMSDPPSASEPQGKDLIVLRMTAQLDGTALPAAHTLAALPLGYTNDGALKAGDELTISGYAKPAAGMVPMMQPVFGEFSVIDRNAADGPWIRFDKVTHPGQSGGPVLNSQGKVVAWVVRSQMSGGQPVCSELRPVESLEPLLAQVLIDLEPELAGDGQPELRNDALRDQLMLREAQEAQRLWVENQLRV